MKKILLAVSMMLVAPIISAQTCGSPGGPYTAAPVNTSGDTCNVADEFAQVCALSIISGGPSNVYQIEVGSGNNFGISVTPTDANYDAALFLVGPGACAQTTGCPSGGDADNAGPGGAETLSFSGIASGTYYIVVDSTAGTSNVPGSASCGNYDLAITGTLPVKLQKFSVN